MVTDADFMRRAMFHAGRSVGVTTPNPLVGAILVSPDGVVVGQGRHPRAGEPHAEVFAIEDAGDRSRGATMFVNLEPCCHIGRTGPCTKRIIAAGIARVVAAMPDPNPLVAGKGFAELRAHGVRVDVGIVEQEALRLNRAFTIVQTEGRPMVIAKAATSLDSRIAAAPGVRTPLTSAAANRRTQRLRAGVDAIGVGSGTLLADDPILTVRDCYRLRPLTRVVFDRRLRTPATARLFSTLTAGPVIIVTTAAAVGGHPERAEALKAVGATLIEGVGDLRQDLCALVPFDISTLLLEGGAVMHAAAWQAGVVDRVHVIVAPTALGERGVRLFDGIDLALSELIPVKVEMLGPDAWMEADVHGHR
ncbi:MAG TPA: bifunctional diaminohydroxyphosphoribosylaminopyrimidine deaminase/5-amino-6-(5-phosphoribosylamino)uracil reductase RibD [Vicinamibacterales bacterium]|nr:bifunctional diaminohydroxyphosphoribosylaminopyrimidine deaminase/5-amino-6-(5-phosphoribosylamino)uracil reductase RibD [Vicinamibacterales bacterium]